MINFFCLPLSFIWFISCLAETNRTPFDFADGESELVSNLSHVLEPVSCFVCVK
jgi:NADH-ubiquinone oxidoreductase chain 1